MSLQNPTIVHHEEISRRLKDRYSVTDVQDLLAFLKKHGTLSFKPLSTGLFPAAGIDLTTAAVSGYGNVWVRDNVYVAMAHEKAGFTDIASNAINALASFFLKYRSRFEAIVNGHTDPKLPMNRPQVRFDGVNLLENSSKWSHAQNDALGYFLWKYCQLAQNGHLTPNPELLTLFGLYFETIRYWEDEDSGHWEERRKIEASSIGAAVAGLKALRGLVTNTPLVLRFEARVLTLNDLDRLIEAGNRALASILPSECTQADPKCRRYDSALLFLDYPLNVVTDTMGQQIVNDVISNLQGAYGIRRYLGDSYWTADYKDKLPPEARTADVSDQQDSRDALGKHGEEAQWCIFDPIISIIFGRRYLRTGEPEDLEQQIHHLNRSLGQITGPTCPQGGMRCPEAYYLEDGRYVPNDHVPLLWTQANLWLALLTMEESADRLGAA